MGLNWEKARDKDRMRNSSRLRNNSTPATGKQIRYLEVLARKLGVKVPRPRTSYGATIEIERLQQMSEER